MRAENELLGTDAFREPLETVNAFLRANPMYPQIGADGTGFTESVAVYQPEERWLVAIARDERTTLILNVSCCSGRRASAKARRRNCFPRVWARAISRPEIFFARQKL